MSIAALIRLMAAAGAPPEAIAIAVEAIEGASAKDAERREKQAERKRRSRQSRDSHVTVTGQDCDSHATPLAPPCLDKEIPPAPPKEINPNPPLPPISVGSPQAKRPAPTNRAPVYHKDFEFLWKDIFPKHPNASKPEAFKRWSQLTDEDRDKCFDGALAYAKYLARERQKRPDHPGLHLSTFINERRFDSHLEAAQ